MGSFTLSSKVRMRGFEMDIIQLCTVELPLKASIIPFGVAASIAILFSALPVSKSSLIPA
jgi:hypothetical protein